MELDVKLESERFDSALKILMKVTGASQEQVIKSEFRSMLGRAMDLTNRADKSKIKARFDYRGLGGEQSDKVLSRVMIDGKRIYTKSVHKKGMWVSRYKGKNAKKGKGNYWDPNRINPKYKKVKALFDKKRKFALSQSGQSKATWVHLAKKINMKGMKLGKYKVPAYVQNVVLPRRLKGKLNMNFGTNPLDYFVESVNAGDTATAPEGKFGGSGARNAMKYAFKGRKDFYSENLSKGVFNTTKKALRAYPELRLELDS